MTHARSLGLLLLPLILIQLFLVTSIALFFLGPIPWPLRDYTLVLTYLSLALPAIGLGFVLGATSPARANSFAHWKAVLVFGAFASCAMLFPSAYIYTGKMPWQILDALADQKAAYQEFQEQLVETEGSRGPIVLVRSLTFWATVAVLPLAFFFWRQLTWWMLLLVLGAVVSTGTFSLLRGTDREIADLAIMLCFSGLAVLGRTCSVRQKSLSSFLLSRKTLIVALALIVAGAGAFELFVSRKTQRIGNNAETCIGETGICADHRHHLMRELGPSGQFGLALFSAYLSQGYYGLALALDKNFESTLGIGHSNAVTRIYESFSQDRALYENSYTYRLSLNGWSDKHHWSSMFTWIANDIGIPLTIVVVGLMAWAWARTWRDTITTANVPALILFCLLSQAFFYIPVNNQLTLTLETYAALLIWLGLWIAGKKPA